MEPDLREAVYRTFEERFVGPALQGHKQFLEVKAEEMQRAVGTIALGKIRQVCALMKDDDLLCMAALELIEREGPDSHLATKFRYKIHGAS
jgi:hypothetical protein